MKKTLITVIALIILFWLGSQVYRLQKERISLAKEYGEVGREYNELLMDNQKIADKMKYLSEARNLEKELRSKLNYIHPGEKLIIVVPEEEGAGEE
jgi:cell division protein FtsB